MWFKIGGFALVAGLLGLLIWLYGGARYHAGEANERTKWEGKVAEANAAQLKGYQLGIANQRQAETVYQRTIETKLVPVTRTIIERAAAYAQTPDGQRVCLPPDRVLALTQARSALFPAPAPTAPSGGGLALRADPPGAQPGRFNVVGAIGAEPRPR